MRVILFLLFLTSFVSCGTYTSQTQTEKATFIQINGKVNGEVLELDNSIKITLGQDTESFDLNGKEVTKIKIDKGKHKIIVSRNGKEIVKRVFFVSEGNTFELELP